jgi:hypothetical protein
MDDYASDTSSHSSDLDYQSLNPLDSFISKEGDNIIDLFHDLKERFPYFLGDRSEKLFELIIDHIFFHKENLPSKDLLISAKFNDFVFEFQQEIHITYNVLTNFLRSRKYTAISENNWTYFCFISYLAV